MTNITLTYNLFISICPQGSSLIIINWLDVHHNFEFGVVGGIMVVGDSTNSHD